MMQEIHLRLISIVNMEINMVNRSKAGAMKQMLWEDMQASNLKMELSGESAGRLNIKSLKCKLNKSMGIKNKY